MPCQGAGIRSAYPWGICPPNRKKAVMRSAVQLLESIRENKAKRLRYLESLEKSQLIRMIENNGHFDSVNDDITWLENYIKQMEAK